MSTVQAQLELGSLIHCEDTHLNLNSSRYSLDCGNVDSTPSFLKLTRHMNTQNDLREALIKKRKQVSRKLIDQHAEALFEQFKKAKILESGIKLGAYYACQGEMDLTPIIEYCWSHHIDCYLPVLHTGNEGHLLYAPYTKRGKLKKNKFNIPEPACDRKKHIDPQELDIVLLPLVGFDLLGNRIGMGQGFYDRTFHAHKKLEKPFLIGCAHGFQQVHAITPNAWDIKLDAIATENKFTVFR